MDISNIYNLSEEKFLSYQTTPFPDDEIRPGLKEFAKKFKEEIIALPTPYVMALEGGYGTGKTYFITRFCEYLKKSNFDGDEQIFSIYLNLWEHDYVADPFPVIASRIISSLNPGQELQQSIKEKAIKVTKNAIKFGSKIFGAPDFSELLPDLDQDKKDLSEFKQEMQKIIAGKGKKVILVVDELDRCKPDYAVKSLETIKHFFDIDGLFVILTTKLDFMDNICEAYYGHPNCKINMGEGYIQKFVQSKKILNPTSSSDYLFIINGILNKDTLPVRMPNFGQALERDCRENLSAIETFKHNMAELFNSAQFSIRKTIDVCKEVLNIIKRHKEEIWERKLFGYPEFILSRYLKAKHILSDKISDPEVMYEYPQEQSRLIERDLQTTLNKLL